MRVTSNGKAWRSKAERRTICERFAKSGLGSNGHATNLCNHHFPL